MSGMLGAARAGDYDNVLAMLEDGEDVNQTGQYSLTPLHLASLNGKTEVQ